MQTFETSGFICSDLQFLDARNPRSRVSPARVSRPSFLRRPLSATDATTSRLDFQPLQPPMQPIPATGPPRNKSKPCCRVLLFLLSHPAKERAVGILCGGCGGQPSSCTLTTVFASWRSIPSPISWTFAHHLRPGSARLRFFVVYFSWADSLVTISFAATCRIHVTQFELRVIHLAAGGHAAPHGSPGFLGRNIQWIGRALELGGEFRG